MNYICQAVDLVEWREVAVKVHQLNPQWNEHKRESYVKHAVRPLHLACIPPVIGGCSSCFLINLVRVDLRLLLIACEVNALRQMCCT